MARISSQGIATKVQAIVLALFLLVSIAVAVSFYISQQDAERKGEEEKIRALADGVINGANMLMINGIISDAEQRKLFIKKMGSSDHIKALRLIRNKLVQKQFGQGLPEEQPAAPEEVQALEDGKVLFEERGDTLHGIVPYTESKDFRGTNCLMCHDVPEGYHNGASVIDLDISADKATLHSLIWKSVVAILLFQLLMWLLIKFILNKLVTQPVGRMKSAIVHVGNSNDFTHRVAVTSNDEVGHAASAFNDLMQKLQDAFSQLHDGIDKLATSSTALSNSSLEVAANSAHQSEAAAAMASTVEELTVSIGEVSEGARVALKHAETSGELSEKGSEIIHRATDEINKIADKVRDASVVIQDLGEQSSRISSIIQVISDIAEQTNLLALNAAIEAARAGEQGRGFAVVADEVRKLAERTQKSTGEISGMINSMQESSRAAVEGMVATVGMFDEGTALAQQADESIKQIQEESRQSHQAAIDISSALLEQNTASTEIAGTVEKVAQMTEENSAAANNTASAAIELSQLADEMRATVSKFKI
jgi:methyl-accepting chemotaxis protein